MTTRSRLWPISLLIGCGFALAAPPPAEAQTSYVFIGQIIEVPYNFCPQGFAEPLGQLLSIQQWEALFSLIGTTYGGDGRVTFELPYIPPKTLRDGTTVLSCIALSGTYPSRP